MRARADDRVLAAVSDAVRAITSELRVGPVLQRIVDAARGLVGAPYAALGVPDGTGRFGQFVTSGVSDEQHRAIGPLPRTHGLLGAMLADPEPFRFDDIRTDPRFVGWPPAHPELRAFLGVPIVSQGRILGALYLANKPGGFDDDDQRLIELLAAHAAIAITNGRLYERSRELSIVAERNRLARDLHDAVSQTLFSVVLTAETAATLLPDDPQQARAHLEGLKAQARQAITELREIIFELRPADLDADGLVATLRKHVAVLRRAHPAVDITLLADPECRLGEAAQVGLFRVAQEALSNAIAHAGARTVEVRLEPADTGVRLVVRDDGVGMDPGGATTASDHLGLVSMRERAAELGGTMRITSDRGAGTTVTVTVPAAGGQGDA